MTMTKQSCEQVVKSLLQIRSKDHATAETKQEHDANTITLPESAQAKVRMLIEETVRARKKRGDMSHENATSDDHSSKGDDTSQTDKLILGLIKCKLCSNSGAEAGARAYLMDPPLQINLCTNRLPHANDVVEALTHEAVHAYDYAVLGWNFQIKENLACRKIEGEAYVVCDLDDSEVKAATHAECAFPLFKSHFLQQRCVKKTASKAVASFYSSEEATTAVNKVFVDCYKTDLPENWLHKVTARFRGVHSENTPT